MVRPILDWRGPMSSRVRLAWALKAALLLGLAATLWSDYSRRALERAVDSAPRTKDLTALKRALEGRDEDLRRKAAEAAIQIGPEAGPAVPALTAALSKPDSSFTYATHGAIIRALGSIGPAAKPAVPKLVELLEQPRTDGRARFVRDGAVHDALGRIGPAADAAIPALLRRLKHDNAITGKDRAIRALGQIGPASKDVAAALVANLDDVLHRTATVDALTRFGPVADEAVSAYIDRLFESVDSPGAYVRVAGGAIYFVPIEAAMKMRALGGLGTPKLRGALGDRRERVRVFAAEALVEQGESSTAVVDVLTKASDRPAYRGGAVASLSKVGPSARGSLPMLRKLAAEAGVDSPYKTALDEAIKAIGREDREAPDRGN